MEELETNQPIQMRFNELMTGIRQDVAIKFMVRIWKCWQLKPTKYQTHAWELKALEHQL